MSDSMTSSGSSMKGSEKKLLTPQEKIEALRSKLKEKNKQESVFKQMIESEGIKRRNVEDKYKRLLEDFEKLEKVKRSHVENAKKLQSQLTQTASLRAFLESEISVHQQTIAVLEEEKLKANK